MANAKVHLERRGAVALVTLDNPRDFNAMDQDMGPQFVDALGAVSADGSLRVAVITGAGGVFCAGGNLKRAWRHLQQHPHEGAGEVFWSYTGHVHQAVHTMLNMPQATICAVEGAASGAGLAWVLCSDLTVCANDAKLVAGFLGVGLTPAAGVTHLLTKAVGLPLASEMLLLNQGIPARRAAELGLVNHLTEPGRTLEHALALAHELAQNSGQALVATKKLMNKGRVRGLYNQMARERKSTAAAAENPDFRRLMHSFFGNKNRP